MNFKRDWWKLLSVVLMVYVIAAGLLLPLKPGIVTVSPTAVTLGNDYSLKIETYNFTADENEEHQVFLKFDEGVIVEADALEINGQSITAQFNLGLNIPTKRNSATLIVNNTKDGYAILPDALFVKAAKTKSTGFRTADISAVKTNTEFKFPYRNILVETIRNTFFHVAIWMSMFVILLLSLINSIKYLRKSELKYDMKASAYANVGIVFGLIGIATGSMWARFTWGAFWTSDVKLNMAAISLLIYVAYWILRGSIESIDTKARIAAMYNIFAFFTMIPLLLILPRMTDSLHPGSGGNPALGGEDLDNTLRMVFYPAIIALFLLGKWMADLDFRIKKLNNKSLEDL